MAENKIKRTVIVLDGSSLQSVAVVNLFGLVGQGSHQNLFPELLDFLISRSPAIGQKEILFCDSQCLVFHMLQRYRITADYFLCSHISL